MVSFFFRTSDGVVGVGVMGSDRAGAKILFFFSQLRERKFRVRVRRELAWGGENKRIWTVRCSLMNG